MQTTTQEDADTEPANCGPLTSLQTVPVQEGFLTMLAISWEDCVDAIAAVLLTDSPPDFWLLYIDSNQGDGGTVNQQGCT